MALLLSKPTQFGVDATYWRIIFVQIDFGSNRMAVAMAGYVNQAAREAGLDPITQEQVAFEAEAFIPEPSRTAVYSAVQMATEWQGAKSA